MIKFGKRQVATSWPTSAESL